MGYLPFSLSEQRYLLTSIGIIVLTPAAEAITEQKMKLAWDPNNKSKSDPHILTLEPVPALPIGTKPHKEDEDGSTRASTPMSHDAPLTHVKGLQKDVAPKVSDISAFTLRQQIRSRRHLDLVFARYIRYC
jgi:hypothetical protein